MRFEGILGIWAFSFVCLAIVITIFFLKAQYDKEQKNKKPADSGASKK